MIIHVARLKEKENFPFQLSLADFPRLQELGLVRALGAKGEVEIIKKSDSIHFLAAFALEAEVLCGRCLEPLALKHKMECPLELYSEGDWAMVGKQVEISMESLDQDIYDGEKILMEKYIEDQLLLDLPEECICCPDCKGLCPKCGVNLNQKICACPGETQNNPFKNLKFF